MVDQHASDGSENAPRIRLKNLPLHELRSRLLAMGEPAFRATQVIKWTYQKRVGSFDAMNNIAKTTRTALAATFTLDKLDARIFLTSTRRDAVKFGFALLDSPHIAESVLLIDGDRRTACLSSQLGCGLGCTFCETGRLGFIRNLTQDEILGQLIGINDYQEKQGDKAVTNIVFMGMGEALSNFDAFRSSLAIIMDNDAFNIGGRRITVFTAGVVPSIDRLIAENLNIGLAISLNACSNDKRSAIMPINKKYPIETLVAAARRYFEKTGRRVTFEYVVVAGETDTEEAAHALFALLGDVTCKINLIPLNPVSGGKVASPSNQRIERFSDLLHRLGLSATIRSSRGADIQGACGQLTAREITATGGRFQRPRYDSAGR
ncbi:MAG: 23S rRNA (adenine(2503)-C(2))-methyltransferase RlmN [Chitinispirillaceae bacterium]|nr:23S rRNA (adenine(2503)-C(2))-methyltransferase RlmN [Chitinispirillaceae bacterium]